MADVILLALIRDFGNMLIMLCLCAIIFTVISTTEEIWNLLLPLGAIAIVLLLILLIICYVYPSGISALLEILDRQTFMTRLKECGVFLAHPTYNEEHRRFLLLMIRSGLFGCGLGTADVGNITILKECTGDYAFLTLTAIFGVPVAVSAAAAIGSLMLPERNTMETADYARFYLIRRLGALVMILQTIEVIGGTSGIFPFTGIVFPFLAAGGTFLIVSYMMIGMMLGNIIPEPMQEEVQKLYDKLESELRKILSKVKNQIPDLRNSITYRFMTIKK